MATRYVGKHTKITIRWEPAGRHDPAWVEGNYKASFNANGEKMDNVILHVFKERAATGRTREDLGLAANEMGTPHGYDVATEWAIEELIRGAHETPHWRYGRALAAARELERDIAENGDEIRRSRR